jgi:hypothetical protein
MGEYWKPVNVTRREFIHPHSLNNGLKLGEWTWPDSSVVRAMAMWSDSDDVRIVSDYGGEIQVCGTPDDEVDYHDLGTVFKEVTETSDNSRAMAALVYEAVKDRIGYDDWKQEWYDYLTQEATE